MSEPNYQFKCPCGAIITTLWESAPEKRDMNLLFVLRCKACGQDRAFEGWQGAPLEISDLSNE